MLHLDAAKAMPAIGAMLAQQARQELEKGCELFPETVKARVRKLDEHADAKRTQRIKEETSDLSKGRVILPAREAAGVA